jgi:carbamate kinase
MAKKLAVVAVGGNSLILDPKKVTVEDQYKAAMETTKHIADMIEAGWDVAIGHGMVLRLVSSFADLRSQRI